MKSISRKLTTLQLVCAVLVVALLYTLMNRQLSQRMTENFMAHGDVVAVALAKSVEPSLVNRDLTSVQSALDAVRQWRYRPTLLNGEAVEVDTTIDVIFSLNQ